MTTPYFCCDERRRNAVAGRADLNGIDFIEVLDDESMPMDERQRTLFVHFINDAGALVLEPANILIDGGDRVREVTVDAATVMVDPRAGTTTPVLMVTVASPGDFSRYTLRLVDDPAHPDRLNHFDPLLRELPFSFKVTCPTDFDCAAAGASCQTPDGPSPVNDYLARDFSSLRQLLLDRLTMTTPSWTERNPADPGVALVELLAYVGDYLSYQQDAIATEAYLGTARSRISVRRHARLVDYHMHDGCSARVWVHVEVSDPVTLPAHAVLLTAIQGVLPRIDPASPIWRVAAQSQAVAFETVRQAPLHPDHNRLHFHTWGQRECCLPRGATTATLRGPLPNLQPGDVLIFEEVVGPATGDAADADFSHRHAVELVEVVPASDPIGHHFDEAPSDAPLEVVDIRWADADALPFSLCLSAEADARYGGGYVPEVSVAIGNIVLAEQGLTVEEDLAGAVPASTKLRLKATSPPGSGDPNPSATPGAPCRDDPFEPIPARFRFTLSQSPVSHTVIDDPQRPHGSATATLNVPLAGAVPAVELRELVGIPEVRWTPQRDLLGSGPDDRHFVVEVDTDGRASLRFGDDRHGSRPPHGMRFHAKYRVGNGTAGNVGGNTLTHIVTADTAIAGVSNPMPARGGIDPETIAEVRERAPYAFREQARAVTPQDYAARASRATNVQRAAATMRWTGSWHTMFVSVDRTEGNAVDGEFKRDLRQHIEPFRLAGHDVEIDGPRFVPLEIAMRVSVRPGYLRSDVRTALLNVFGSGRRPRGRLAMFHPDNLTFGQTVYLSPIYEAAAAVDGVACVDVTRFQRRGVPGRGGLDTGQLTFGRLEVPRLDNDPNFPERGILRLDVDGGR